MPRIETSPRPRARSIPPPIPPAERRKRPTLVSIPSRPESPSVIDRALAELAQLDDAARAARIARSIETLMPADPAGAAQLAFALGERYELRLGDDERAAAAYRRALELDASLGPALWALRRMLHRRARWSDLVKLIDAQLTRTPGDRERVELLVERAVVLGHQGDANDQARIALAAAVQLAPRHQGALFELERVVVRSGDGAALLDVWERLAGAVDHPARKIVYWLALARSAGARDHDRAGEALDIAAELIAAARTAPWSYPLAERVARERLRIADALGTPDQVGAAVDALVKLLADPPNPSSGWRRELVALHRRRAQLVRTGAPGAAWEHLQKARALAPEEPVVLADLLELAAELGRHDDLPGLASAWCAVEADPGRMEVLSRWCADAHLAEQRQPLREMLGALASAAPGFLLLTSAAECDALANVLRVRTRLDLGHTYLAAADAAARGTWLGPGSPPRPDRLAAAALYVQAAHLLAYEVATAGTIDLARDALGKALEAAPGHPGVLEALTELDDSADRAEQAVARLRELATTAQDGRALVERALRIAYGHDLHHTVLEAARELVRLAPDDAPLAWRLEAMLLRRGYDDERAALLDRLAQGDPDPARRRTALVYAARLHERAGNAGAAADRYRQLLGLWPEHAAARDARIDLLRAEQRWAELVDERQAEAGGSSDLSASRRALREAAWVLEIWLGNAASAAAVYDDWLARLPDDRTALEGIARCRAALGEHDREAAARAAIAAIDRTPEARWLAARSLERAARHDQAVEQYRGVIGGPEPSVAAASAALALGDLAARCADVAMSLEAVTALAEHTTDPALGAGLHDLAGWMHLIALDDTARAAQLPAAARALASGRPSALLGAALVAARRSEPLRQAEAYVGLASAVREPGVAGALHLRAAAIAIANGDRALADRQLEAARLAGPDDDHVLLVAAEGDPPEVLDTGDPFAALDQLLDRAELLGRREALSDDPAVRASWQLDRAETLELAGQAREASAILAAVLRDNPADRRALSAVRRIAERASDRAVWAQASYALARLSRDPGSKLQLLRDAIEVYGSPGPANHPGHALTIYRQILAADPGAPEFERLCELLRERGRVHALIGALTDRLSWLSATHPIDDSQMIALLLQRSALLYGLSRRDQAAADLDAILDHAPRHMEALRCRADLAILAGEVDHAATLWWAYLEVETTAPRRAEIELQLAQALGTGVIPPPKPVPRAVPIGDQTAPHRIDEDTSIGSPAIDPLGSTTVTDLSGPPEQEARLAEPVTSRLSLARAARDDATGAIGGFAPEDTAEVPHRMPWPPALDRAELLQSAAIQEAAADPAELEPVLDAGAIQFPEEPQLSLDDSDVVMLMYEQLRPVWSDEACADLLHRCEREIAAGGDPASLAALRIEAGQLAGMLGDDAAACAHYEAALAEGPRATAALRGLRRIARRRGDLAEMIRLVDAELAGARARERDALLRYRIDLLMAAGEHDLARVYVGELLDAAPPDLPVILAHLELALLDDRTHELGQALEMLARGAADPELRAAALSARAIVCAHQGDLAAAATWSTAAAEAAPDSPAARLEAIHRTAARDPRAASAAYLDLACHIEAEDPITAAALALRAQLCTAAATQDPHRREGGDRDRATLAAAAQLAVRAAPRDPLVARIATETALAVGDRSTTSHAFARWARCASAPIERAHAAARAAELEPARLGRLWAQVLEHDPGDDYAAARLRAAYAASGDTRLAIDLDLQIARDTGRDAPLVRAATELIDDDQIDAAIDALARAREQRPASEALADALADALAEAGRWTDRARVLGALTGEPGALAPDIARLRAALAWDRAARAAVGDRDGDRDELRRVTVAALDAWDLVLEDDSHAAVAHAARLALASRLGDPDLQIDVLARAQSAERSPWAAASLGLRRAHLLSAADPRFAEDVARDAGPGLDDPRRTLAVMMAAARRRDLGGAATALEDRARLLESMHGQAAADAAPSLEPAALRLRAAHLALDAGDPERARALLVRVDPVLPGVAGDLLDAARRRAGEPPSSDPPPMGRSFVRSLRDAELAAAQGRTAWALARYQRALELRPADPLAAGPLVRIATALRDAQPIAQLALEQLRTAEATADATAKAGAYELLAHAQELRGDAAQIALEAAVQADPTRIDLLHRLERELVVRHRHGELVRLREQQLAQLERSLAGPAEHARDRAALDMDAAILAVRAGSSDAALARRYRAVLDADHRHQGAALGLEAILLRAGWSEDLAALEDHLAETCDDPPGKAAFLVRAGDALAALGKPAEAVQRFARAIQALPGYLPALETWLATALAHKLWRELAEVVTHQANLNGEPRAVAALHHLAGVALMDKAQAAEPAIAALRRALELDPGHVDSFVRLRILLAQTGSRDQLALLLRRRLEIEPDRAAQIELHRLLAEHECASGDREAAMQHYRAVLKLDPTDVRAHAAIADLASWHGSWQGQVAAVMARVPLERDPGTLRTLHYRLGLLHADHDVASALGAFQRALTFQPGDKDSLIRITDLATAAGQWQVAFDACNRLMRAERDPEKLVSYLHRAAVILARGFGDRKRADRMIKLALDNAPTSTEGLGLLIEFYQDASDPAGLCAQLDRVTAAMRARIAKDAGDGAAYRILARAIAARAEHVADGSLPIARAAAELAQLLGAGDALERRLIAARAADDPALLLGSRSDELIFAQSVQPEVRQIFRLVAQPLARHVGVDLDRYGVGRKDRLTSGDPALAIAREVAASVGFKDLHVYVSSRDPYLMIAEPTSPVSLLLGQAITGGGEPMVRFAAAAVLKLGQLSLAIPARLPPDELAVLGFAVLRLFRPELISPDVPIDEVNAQLLNLRRLIPAALLEEAEPYARAVVRFDPEGFARALKIAGLRAGLLASGSLVPGLAILAAGGDPRSVLPDPIAQGLISFALSDARAAAPP